MSIATKSFKELTSLPDDIKDNIFMLPLPTIDGTRKSVCKHCGREFDKIGNEDICYHCYHIGKCNNCGERFLVDWSEVDLYKQIGATFCSEDCKNEIGKKVTLNLDICDPDIIVTWGNVDIGHVFPDGSIVSDTREWSSRQMYKLVSNNGDSIIVSDNHLISCQILASDGDLINGSWTLSAKCRGEVGEIDDAWICAADLFDAKRSGYIVILESGYLLEKVEPLSFGDVRCITTDTGEYSIGAFTNHNCARQMYMGLSDTPMIEDCGNSNSTSIMTCDMPTGFCRCCAEKSGMKDVIDNYMKKKSTKKLSDIKIGGLISTNASEPLTQMALNKVHSAADSEANSDILIATYRGYSTSPIIQAMKEETTTMGRRKVLFENLKKLYEEEGIDIDDWNLEIIAKKMTSYKKGKHGLEIIDGDDDLCSISSLVSIGTTTNPYVNGDVKSNPFKRASYMEGYETLKKPTTYVEKKTDSWNSLFDI